MGNLRIDYPGLTGLVDEGVQQSKKKRETKARLRSLPARAGRALLLAAVLAVLPFVLLVRGGVFAYQEWALGTWLALLVSAAASALLLGLYA